MADGIDYTSDEWKRSAGHFPLSNRPAEDLVLLHRHWMWANQEREAFDSWTVKSAQLPHEPGPLMMATREIGFMFVWYGLLWAVVEACVDPAERRNVPLSGPFRADIDSISSILRPCRNA